MKAGIPFVLVLSVLVFGCTALPEPLPEKGEAIVFAEGLAEVQEFRAAHPGAEVSAVFIPENDFRQMFPGKLPCSGMKAKDYWLIELGEKGNKVQVWAGRGLKKAECVSFAGEEFGKREPLKGILCESVSQCRDSNPCTTDLCEGSPAICVNRKLTECVSGDSCCPANCSGKNDSDCLAGAECGSAEDCDDFDLCTDDSCEGVPQKCVHAEIEGCSSGKKCSSEEDCDDGIWESREECIEGECRHRLATCEEFEGEVCTEGTECDSTPLRAFDTAFCCTTQCIPLEEDLCEGVKCGKGMRCMEGACIPAES